jgi:hypothetical protein
MNREAQALGRLARGVPKKFSAAAEDTAASKLLAALS